MKIIGLIVGLVKMILNIKKWISAPYRMVMFCTNHPNQAMIYVGVILVVIAVYLINVI